MPREAFFTLHRDLPREGPGEPADVMWALEVAGLSGKLRVVDAACGPGADLVTLAQNLPEAEIMGVDKTAHFVDDAKVATASFGDRVRVEQRDMATLTGPLDFIWCAGALYFLGVEEGLHAWAPALAPGARVAFSHPVTQAGDPPGVAAFWQGEPGVGPRERTEAAIAGAGYTVLDYRRIEGAPWEAYYGPQADRIKMLRAGDVSPELAEVLTEGEQQIALWRANSGHIAYGLWVVAHEH